MELQESDDSAAIFQIQKLIEEQFQEMPPSHDTGLFMKIIEM